MLWSWGTALGAQEKPKPNLVYVLCDDLGYGDVHALNPQRGKIPTPNIDRLAREGMTFTDAHSGSSVCTPTRYGVMTGRYAWRTRLQHGVLDGFSPPLISPRRLTVAGFLQQQGYATACLGKWHLGMQWPGQGKTIDYPKPITEGPTERGFDYFYGISASLDMFPFIWIENNRTVGAATAVKKWVRSGPAEPGFEAGEVLPTLARKAVAYLHQRATATDGKPFFLYLPFSSPHAPILPTREWQGKSGLGDYADFVMETDWAAGEVLQALRATGLATDTLVIFTSDNGCSPVAKPAELEAKGHYPSAQLRGYKADIWDGGHRVPFIVSWPGKVKPGSHCASLVCLTDFMATAAEIAGARLPDDAAEDSYSFLPDLLGTGKTQRKLIVHHSITGRFAVRDQRWKLELCPGSGGWSSPRDPEAGKQALPAVQLYDMAADLAETNNLQAHNPGVVERLTAELDSIVAKGRSTPGTPQVNDVAVNIKNSK